MEMEWDLILRLCVAGLCGTVIGLDREYRVKDAGFRTHFLVALGSALMMIVSQYGFEGFLATHDGLRLDPSRIAAQVVSGIGFIGAGTIIIHRQLVRGLTTAASLWATAGIGLAAGGHMYIVAGAATLLTLFALEVLTLFFGRLGRRRIMVVFSAADRKAIDAMFNELQSGEYAVISYEVEAQRSPDGVVYRATLVIRAKGNADEERYVDLLRENPDVTVERIVENQRYTSRSVLSCDMSLGLVPGTPSGTDSPRRAKSSVQNCGSVPSSARKFIGWAVKIGEPSLVR